MVDINIIQTAENSGFLKHGQPGVRFPAQVFLDKEA